MKNFNNQQKDNPNKPTTQPSKEEPISKSTSPKDPQQAEPVIKVEEKVETTK